MKKYVVAWAALCLASAASAQKTNVYDDASAQMEQAFMLYDASMYGAARSAFANFQKKWNDATETSELQEDAKYMEALCAKMLTNPDAPQMLEQFQLHTQNNQHRHDAYFHLADFYLSAGKEKNALKWFQKVDPDQLTDDSRVELFFKRGYCLFMQGQHNLALAQFDKIKGQEGEYASAINYYRAHVAYENGNLDEALQAFVKLEKEDGFSTAAAYYIAHIMYLQGHYAEAARYAKPLAEQGGAKAAEMTRILADSYFMQGDYVQALATYDRLQRLSKSKILRADNYHVGMCHFHLGDFDKASAALSRVTSQTDEIAQNAYYYLGACYIKMKDKKRARTAFEAASRYAFDPSISEDAHFNKLKLAYELNFSPFDEIVSQFMEFLNLYPATSHRDEVYDYMGKALVSTKNYTKALETLEKIQHKNLSLYKALQRISFYHALDLYTNHDLDGAARFFDYSLKYGDYDALLKARAYYWQGACLYQNKQIDDARDKFSMFINAYRSSELAEFPTAHYDVGYTYYNKKDYVNARRWFVRYVAFADKGNINLLADAYNRLGDCLYVDRDFSGAVKFYNKAQAVCPAQGDYSLLQKGICFGLQNNQDRKVVVLDSLIAKYPKSVYVDNAFFEKARAYVAMNQIADAIYNFKVVKERYPKGSLASQAMLQLGLLYYNNSEYDNSMAFYKRVINEYPSTPEAADALAGLRNVYMENGDYDGYIAYTSTLGSFAHVSQNERDSLLFVSASHNYMNGKFVEAKAGFRRYLDTYPDGRNVTPANYYLADICYADKEFDESLSLYLVVTTKPRSIFTEDALIRSGELLFKKDDFSSALNLFTRLENESEIESNIIEAIIGQMRCLSKMGNAQQCISGADKVIAMPQASPDIIREAQYLKAKSLFAINRGAEAKDVLAALATNTKSAEGAEAKFLLAQLYYNEENAEAAEAEIFDYVEKGTPHQYWLARSFVLLADIYHDKGDDFQASQYLQTLKDSYSADDDISGMISERLQGWAQSSATLPE